MIVDLEYWKKSGCFNIHFHTILDFFTKWPSDSGQNNNLPIYLCPLTYLCISLPVCVAHRQTDTHARARAGTRTHACRRAYARTRASTCTLYAYIRIIMVNMTVHLPAWVYYWYFTTKTLYLKYDALHDRWHTGWRQHPSCNGVDGGSRSDLCLCSMLLGPMTDWASSISRHVLCQRPSQCRPATKRLFYSGHAYKKVYKIENMTCVHMSVLERDTCADVDFVEAMTDEIHVLIRVSQQQFKQRNVYHTWIFAQNLQKKTESTG